VTGTPVNFGGMTGRALAVIFKLIFFKSCEHKKSFFIGPQTGNFMGHPIYGLYMDSIWTLYGLYMDSIWTLYGLYMDSIWTLYGEDSVTFSRPL
jgi:hypothetical protein